MSIRLVKRKEIDENLAAELSKKLSVSLETAKLLLIREYDTCEKAKNFLYPSLDNMSNPFDIKNMDICVKRLQQAIDNNESVIVYGDYDCDGLSALTIFVLYLKKFLTNVTYYVPNRNEDGYGITIEALESIIENYKPDLIISVDCGITAVDEVDFLKKKCVDVIITDHHEPQKTIPDCIVVDPKIDKNGFCDYCGAGVVLKIIEAHGGRAEALNYIGYAAVATVADIVPLTGDNRLIAYFGLKKINSENCNLAINVFKKALKIDKITSQDIMFKIAPRLNAAGRIGDATKTMDLFFSNDYATTEMLFSKLNEDNIKRQKLCEQLVLEVKEKLTHYDFNEQRIILLYDSNWSVGILGIAASKLADTFHRPAILFAEKDGILKGSARSIKGINLFEILSKFSDLFINFGGHAAAAGVSIELSKFETFKNKINEYLKNNIQISEYWPEYVYDVELSVKDCNLKLADELDLFEPTGYQNILPSFYLKEKTLPFTFINNTFHIKAVFDNCEIMLFNGARWHRFSTAYVHNLISISRQEYKGRVYAQGIIKKCFLEELNIVDNNFRNALIIKQLYDIDCNKSFNIEICDAEKFLTNDVNFGTLFIAFYRETYDNFCKKCKNEGKFIMKTVMLCQELSPYNAIVFMPDHNYLFEYYNNIIFLDKPICEGYYEYISNKSGADIYLDKNAKALSLNEILPDVPDDKEYQKIFNDICKLPKNNAAIDLAYLYKNLVKNGAQYGFIKFSIAFLVFLQNGLIKSSSFSPLSYECVPCNDLKLNDSPAYGFFKQRKKI